MSAGSSGTFDADSIRSWMNGQRAAREAEEKLLKDRRREELEELRKAFEEREVPPNALTIVQTMIRRAASEGEREVTVTRFPSQWMKDSGRSITSGLDTWPEQLDGFAWRAYGFYEKELAPRGFKLRAVILDYTDGMPGDVGLVLSWKQEL